MSEWYVFWALAFPCMGLWLNRDGGMASTALTGALAGLYFMVLALVRLR